MGAYVAHYGRELELRKFRHTCEPREAPQSNRTTIRRVRRWCSRHAGKLAIGFAIATVALLVLVGVQATMLYIRGWRVTWGSMPEWLAGLGAVAAFGVVWFAAQEWRSGQAERRDREADQARRVVAEPVEEPVPGSRPSWSHRPHRDVVVRNRSDRHILNVDIDPLGGGSDMVVFRNFSQMTRAVWGQPGQFTPQRIPVLHACCYRPLDGHRRQLGRAPGRAHHVQLH